MPELKKALAPAVQEIISDFHDEDELDFENLEIQSSQSESELEVLVRLSGELHHDDLVLAVFHDVFYHLEVPEPEGVHYCFQWEVVGPDQKEPEQVWVLESELSKLPETGMPEEEAWQEFIDQLVFTKDGTPQEMPSPFED